MNEISYGGAASLLLALTPGLHAQTCSNPLPVPDQPDVPNELSLVRRMLPTNFGDQEWVVGSATPYAPVVLGWSPDLAPSPLHLGIGTVVLDLSQLLLMSSPILQTDGDGILRLTTGTNVALGGWIQALVMDPALGRRMTAARPLSDDWVCVHHQKMENFTAGSPAGAPFEPWGAGNTVTSGIYSYTPGGCCQVIQMTADDGGCLAGGVGLRFAGEAMDDTYARSSGGFNLSYWFAVDDQGTSCHDFRHKLLLTPGLTTGPDARTIFEVEQDGSVILHGFDGGAIDTGVDLTLNTDPNWGGSWYFLNIVYMQFNPGAANPRGGLFLSLSDQNGTPLVWRTHEEITFLTGEKSLTHILLEAGLGSSVFDELSIQY